MLSSIHLLEEGTLKEFSSLLTEYLLGKDRGIVTGVIDEDQVKDSLAICILDNHIQWSMPEQDGLSSAARSRFMGILTSFRSLWTNYFHRYACRNSYFLQRVCLTSCDSQWPPHLLLLLSLTHKKSCSSGDYKKICFVD